MLIWLILLMWLAKFGQNRPNVSRDLDHTPASVSSSLYAGNNVSILTVFNALSY